MRLLKKIFRYSVGMAIKIPLLRQLGFDLVEKIPLLRSLIMKMAGSSAVIIENGHFKLSDTENSAYFFGASKFNIEDLTQRQSSIFNQLQNRYHR